MNDALGLWRCRNFHVACFLRYCLPDGSHVATVIEHTGPVFTFSGTERCREFSDMYYGSEPIAIGDLKAFVDITKAIRTTITAAQKSISKRWEEK